MDKTLRQVREKLMIGKCEMAGKAGVSLTTMNRLEKGKPCRPETMRKIIKALGFNPWLKSSTAPGKKTIKP